MLRKFIEYTSALSCVNRFSQSKLCAPENVLEHSGFVTALSFYLASKIIECGHEINMGVLLSKAIMHDFDESLTGDIAMPVKYHNAQIRKDLAEIEDANMKMISEDVKLPEAYTRWETAKWGSGGKIVALADYLSVLFKFHDEIVNRGNKTMYKLIVPKFYVAHHDKFVALIECYPKAAPMLSEMKGECLQMIKEIRGHV